MEKLELSADDCVEIYYAIDGDEELMEAVGVDGELLADGTFQPTAEQRKAIRDAVQNKLDAVKSGFYGKDRTARAWAENLESILDELGEVAEG